MYKFCSIINNGYSSNYKTVKILFKKKYINILDKLVKYNCILNYKINKNFIEVNLKYYNNKPIFRLKICSTNSNNKYFKLYQIKKMSLYNNFTLNIFSTNKGLLTNDEILFKNQGGNFILQIVFLDNKTILK